VSERFFVPLPGPPNLAKSCKTIAADDNYIASFAR
jgi:hypothetical protein